jgi:hypothetical protein
VRGGIKSIIYRLHHVLGIRQYVIVPESQHTKAKRLKACRSFRIIVDLLSVLTTVHLDDQPMFQTHKINYVTIYRMLPVDFDARQTAISKQLP